MVPIVICLFVYWRPDSLPSVTAFAVLGIYISFQAVVLAALRQRCARVASGRCVESRLCGMVVNVLALAYGIFAMILLARPTDAESFLDRWVVAHRCQRRDRSRAALHGRRQAVRAIEGVPEGDALEVAQQLRTMRQEGSARRP